MAPISPAAATSLPPVLNIIALATFAASLTTRALDPVLPHVASDFGVSIAAAAGFASVFAFTFASCSRCWARPRICSARRAW
jgi:predicted MFS family arabinose efflux permease